MTVSKADWKKASADYGVRGIPTMLLFKGGQPVAQKVGAAPRSQIQQWLESNLDAAQARQA